MLGHVAKKQRVDRVQEVHKDGFLQGVEVSPQPHNFDIIAMLPASVYAKNIGGVVAWRERKRSALCPCYISL